MDVMLSRTLSSNLKKILLVSSHRSTIGTRKIYLAMPAPDDSLLKSKAGSHPLGETFGCITGMLQIFEVHPTCIGRRYSSTRKGPPGTRAETDVHCSANFSALDQLEKIKHHRQRIPAVSRQVSMGASESSTAVGNHDVGRSFQKTRECQKGITNTNNEDYSLSSRSYQSYFKRSERPQERGLDESWKAIELSGSSSVSARSKLELAQQKEVLRNSAGLYGSNIIKDVNILNDSDDSAKSPFRSEGRMVNHRGLTDGKCDFRMKSLREQSVSRRDPEQSLSSRDRILFSSPSRKYEHDHIRSDETESKGHRRVPSVIAQLMGLEDIPTSNHSSSIFALNAPDVPSRRDKFFRGLVQFDPQVQWAASPLPPTPCQSKKYVVHGLQPHSAFCQQKVCDEHNYSAQHRMQGRLCHCEENSDYEHASKKPTIPSDGKCRQGFVCPESEQLKQIDDRSFMELEHYLIQDVDANMFPDMVMESSRHKRKIVQKIFETLRPRSLLAISRRKQSDSGIISTDKVTGDGQTATKLDMNHEHQTQADCASKVPKSSTPAKNLEALLYPNFFSQMEEQQIPSGDIVVLNAGNPNRSQVAKADISRVWHVETASGHSNDKETCSVQSSVMHRRKADKSLKFKEALRKEPRNAKSRYNLESDSETGPFSVRDHEKPGSVYDESKKRLETRTNRNLGSRALSPDTTRNQKTFSLHEGRSLLTLSSPNKDYSGGRVVSTKPYAKVVISGRLSSHGDHQIKFSKNSILTTKAFKSSLKEEQAQCDREKPVIMKAKSKKKNTIEVRPRSKTEVGLPSSTTNAAAIDTCNKLDTAFLRSGLTQVQVPDTKPLCEKPPQLRRLKEPIVYVRRSPTQVQKIEDSGRVEPRQDTTQPSKSRACNADLHDVQLILQVRESASKVGEKLTTPRGVALMYDELDDKKAGGLDQPQTSSEADNENSVSVIEANPDSRELYRKCCAMLPSQTQTSAMENRIDRFRAYFKNSGPGERMEFNESLLKSPSGAPDSRSHNDKCSFANFVMKQSTSELGGTKKFNENLLQRLHGNSILHEHDPVLLLDSLKEIIEQVLGIQPNPILQAELVHGSVHAKFRAKKLEQELWIELQDIQRTPPLEDTCESVNILVHKDLHKFYRQYLSSHGIEEGNISQDVEGMIVDDLLEETIRDLCTL